MEDRLVERARHPAEMSQLDDYKWYQELPKQRCTRDCSHKANEVVTLGGSQELGKLAVIDPTRMSADDMLPAPTEAKSFASLRRSDLGDSRRSRGRGAAWCCVALSRRPRQERKYQILTALSSHAHEDRFRSSMRHALLFFTVPSCKAQDGGPVKITSISPNYGSVAGGLLVTIRGTGFSGDAFTERNDVFIGDTPCEVIDFYSSTEQIVCRTGPAPARDPDTVAVMVGGDPATLGTGCCFTYRTVSTPTLLNIESMAAPAGGRLSITGKYMPGAPGDFQIRLGEDQICVVNDELADGTAAVEDLGSNTYRLTCALQPPTPGQGPRAGLFNVTVNVAGLGHSVVADTAQLSDEDGVFYNFQLFPEVHSVTPTSGSMAGGTLVTITGTGFGARTDNPSISDGGEDMQDPDLSVSIFGIPCEVLERSHTQLVCATGPADESINVTSPTGWYAGGRGVLLERWWVNGWDVGALTSLPAYVAGDPDNETTLYDRFEVAPATNGEAEDMGFRLTSVFEAPRNGTYRFLLSSDDASELWIGGTDPASPSTMTRICELTYATGLRQFDSTAGQVSPPIALTAGSLYPLQALWKQGTGGSHLTVGVRLPGEVYLPNSIREVQRVSLSSRQLGEIQTLELTADEGSFEAHEVTLWNMDELMATNDTSTQVVLTLGGEESAPLWWNASAAEIAAAVEQLEAAGSSVNVTVTSGTVEDGENVTSFVSWEVVFVDVEEPLPLVEARLVLGAEMAGVEGEQGAGGEKAGGVQRRLLQSMSPSPVSPPPDAPPPPSESSGSPPPPTSAPPPLIEDVSPPSAEDGPPPPLESPPPSPSPGSSTPPPSDTPASSPPPVDGPPPPLDSPPPPVDSPPPPVDSPPPPVSSSPSVDGLPPPDSSPPPLGGPPPPTSTPPPLDTSPPPPEWTPPPPESIAPPSDSPPPSPVPSSGPPTPRSSPPPPSTPASPPPPIPLGPSITVTQKSTFIPSLGGRFELALEGSLGTVRRLSAHATEDELATALTRLLDLALDVEEADDAPTFKISRTPALPAGYTWTIAFDYTPTQLPLITVVDGSDLTGTNLDARTTRVRSPSQPLGGLFALQRGETSPSPPGAPDFVTVPFDASAELMADMLNELFGAPPLTSLVRVSASSALALAGGSRTWTITFLTSAHAGDVPELRAFADAATVGGSGALSGLEASVGVREITKGSLDQLLVPIPADLLHVPVRSPGSVSVVVNRAASACVTDGATPGGLGANCRFSYSSLPSVTPTLTSLAPTRGWSGTRLVILGTGFSPRAGSGSKPPAVSVGMAACDTTAPGLPSVTDTKIECILRQGASVGTYPLVVIISGKGAALSSPASNAGAPWSFTVDEINVTDASPQRIASQGGTLVTIHGVGFSEDHRDNDVALGDAPCHTVPGGSAYDTILCVSSPTNATGTVDVTVQVAATDHSAGAQRRRMRRTLLQAESDSNEEDGSVDWDKDLPISRGAFSKGSSSSLGSQGPRGRTLVVHGGTGHPHHHSGLFQTIRASATAMLHMPRVAHGDNGANGDKTGLHPWAQRQLKHKGALSGLLARSMSFAGRNVFASTAPLPREDMSADDSDDAREDHSSEDREGWANKDEQPGGATPRPPLHRRALLAAGTYTAVLAAGVDGGVEYVAAGAPHLDEASPGTLSPTAADPLLTVVGGELANVTSLFLVRSDDPLGLLAGERVPCWVEEETRTNETMVCRPATLPPGTFDVVALVDDGAEVLVLPAAVRVLFGVSSVSPRVGSLGGGTRITIRGAGFTTQPNMTSVVTIPVPVSTTFPNGVVLCDVTAASEDTIECTTRPHCAADSSAEDPSAKLCTFNPTPPAGVMVSACPMGLTDLGKVRCWSQTETPIARCGASVDGCKFAYDGAAGVTPRVTSLSPTSGSTGDVITITGTDLASATVKVGGLACNLVEPATGTSITCRVPPRPVGAYRVEVLVPSLGLAATKAAFAYVTRFAAVAVRGSIQGGRDVTLTGANFNASVLSQNVVSLGQAPCPVVNVSADGTSLTCRALRAGGLLGEYYSGLQGSKIPSLDEQTPSFVRVEQQLDFGQRGDYQLWEGLPYKFADEYAARFSGYLFLPEDGNYTFYLSSDDGSRLWLNGLEIIDNDGNHGNVEVASEPLDLTSGFFQLEVRYFDHGGWQYLTLSYEGPSTPKQVIPNNLLFLHVPETTLPISLRVNNVPATCEGTCTYRYAVDATPVVFSVSPSAIGSQDPAFVVTGQGLSGATLATGPARVTIGGVDCPLLADQSAAAPSGIACAPPPLAAGTYPMTVWVPGMGFGRSLPGASSGLVDEEGRFFVEYTLEVTGVSPGEGSLWGGTLVTVTGFGFAMPMASEDGTTMVTMAVMMDDVMQHLVSVADDGRSAVVRTTAKPGRFPSDGDRSADIMVEVNWVLPEGGSGAAAGCCVFLFTGAATPEVTGVSTPGLSGSPADGEPFALALTGQRFGDTAASSTVWVGFQGLPLGDTSAAYRCNVTSWSATSIACDAPPLPAGTFVVWVDVAGLGYSLPVAAVDIPLVISRIDPAEGGMAGGTLVTIYGNGFITGNASAANTITFRDAPCAVVGAGPAPTDLEGENGSSNNVTTASMIITCITSNASSPGPAPLSIKVGGAPEPTLVPDVAFTYREELTPLLISITPNSGSTAGGTRVTLRGQRLGSEPGLVLVEIDGAPCDVTQVVVPDVEVECVTGPRRNAELTGPMPVKLNVVGRGFAVHSPGIAADAGGADQNGTVTYWYIDRWSRLTTWGLEPPPREGDSVFIPANRTVLLDVSPPLLQLIVVEGVLMFENLADADLALDAHYIFLRGGRLQVGTASDRYRGRAQITLHGGPDSPEVPMYGAKNIAVRRGTVDAHGLPKTPSWTSLSANAAAGATSLTLSEPVNWAVGDEVVVTASSYLPEEAEVRVITGVEAGGTRLRLDQPLEFSHLGRTETYDGWLFDTRAQVGVLSRNVVFQGDEQSVADQYGFHMLIHSKGDDTSVVRLDNVEVRRAGQAFRLGRYPLHFHMIGRVPSSYVVSCAVHNTFNRAIALHGVHGLRVESNVAYHNMGHAYFIEDGIETGNRLEGNLGILTLPSFSLLNTDGTPATFWVTNPNNIVRNNVAAGSKAYGFWYRSIEEVDGASATSSICPIGTPMGEFSGNLAHSNIKYGLRIFPEYHPRAQPCNPYSAGVVALFANYTAYRNGMKGAIATQTSGIHFHNFRLADNGGGPEESASVVNGKDHGGGLEFAWILGNRRFPNRVTSSIIVGRRNSDPWLSPRGVRGLLTQSVSSGLEINGLTLMNFNDPQLFAIEPCAKCKEFQGGFTTTFRNVRYVSSPNLASWSWPHQAVLLDADGTLLGGAINRTMVFNDPLWLPSECSTRSGIIRGAVCGNTLTFRRVGLNEHGPKTLTFMPLLVSRGGRSSVVQFSKYNDFGYQFAVPTGRAYELSWQSTYRVDPQTFLLDPEPFFRPSDFFYLSTRQMENEDHFDVMVAGEGMATAWAALPPTTAPHGSHFYDRNATRNAGDTVHTVLVAGDSSARIRVTRQSCPVGGCFVDGGLDGLINRTVIWSVISSWDTELTASGLPPLEGEKVTVPPYTLLLMDVSPPRLTNVTVHGILRFAPGADLNLTAENILIDINGRLQIGNESNPFTNKAVITLVRPREAPPEDPQGGGDGGGEGNPGELEEGDGSGNGTTARHHRRRLLQRETLDEFVYPAPLVNSGLRVTGNFTVYGAVPAVPWTRLVRTVEANASELYLEDSVDWAVGDEVVLAATGWDPREAEVGVVAAVAKGVAVTAEVPGARSKVTLTSPLSYRHAGATIDVGGGRTLDLRGEVGLLTRNVVIQGPPGASDPSTRLGASISVEPSRFSDGRPMFVAIEGVEFRDVGQSARGIAAVQFLGMGGASEGSRVTGCSFRDSSHSAVAIYDSDGIEVRDNVIFKTFDASAVSIWSGSGNSLINNLAMGVEKVWAGKSSFDSFKVSCFEVYSAGNTLVGNVAAGSDMIGFRVVGDECEDVRAGSAPSPAQSFRRNVAHSALIGLLLLDAAEDRACTGVGDFTAYRCWDFGVLAADFPSNVELRRLTLADNKVGLLLNKKSSMDAIDVHTSLEASAIIGASSPDVCADPPHSRPSPTSNGVGAASYGMIGSTFALKFTTGPPKPWDGLKLYPTIRGIMRITDTSFHNFNATTDACGRTLAAVSNNQKAPDAFHPHVFQGISLYNVADEAKVRLYPPDPNWRNPSDCGNMDCDGPLHVMLQDTDGSFAGTAGAANILGHYSEPRAPRQQGVGLFDPPCVRNEEWNAYLCEGSTHHLFVAQSLDSDTETRRVAPVMLGTGGQVDVINGPQDHGWCFGYTCQKRLSTFWTEAQTGLPYELNFTGTPPLYMRLHLPYAPPGEELLLTINYFEPNRRFAWVKGLGRLSPAASKPALGQNLPHGTYYWDQLASLFTILLKGGGAPVEVRVEPVVLVSQTLAMNIEDFFEENFVSNLAFVLGIDPARIRIVDIRAGSVILKYEIVEEYFLLDADLPQREFNYADYADLSDEYDKAAAEYERPGGASGNGTGPAPLPRIISTIDDIGERFKVAIVNKTLEAQLGVRIAETSFVVVSANNATNLLLSTGSEKKDKSLEPALIGVAAGLCSVGVLSLALAVFIVYRKRGQVAASLSSNAARSSAIANAYKQKYEEPGEKGLDSREGSPLFAQRGTGPTGSGGSNIPVVASGGHDEGDTSPKNGGPHSGNGGSGGPVKAPASLKPVLPPIRGGPASVPTLSELSRGGGSPKGSKKADSPLARSNSPPAMTPEAWLAPALLSDRSARGSVEGAEGDGSGGLLRQSSLGKKEAVKLVRTASGGSEGSNEEGALMLEKFGSGSGHKHNLLGRAVDNVKKKLAPIGRADEDNAVHAVKDPLPESPVPMRPAAMKEALANAYDAQQRKSAGGTTSPPGTPDRSEVGGYAQGNGARSQGLGPGLLSPLRPANVALAPPLRSGVGADVSSAYGRGAWPMAPERSPMASAAFLNSDPFSGAPTGANTGAPQESLSDPFAPAAADIFVPSAPPANPSAPAKMEDPVAFKPGRGPNPFDDPPPTRPAGAGGAGPSNVREPSSLSGSGGTDGRVPEDPLSSHVRDKFPEAKVPREFVPPAHPQALEIERLKQSEVAAERRLAPGPVRTGSELSQLLNRNCLLGHQYLGAP
eukprot:jgi/Mesvir1/5687/Mv15702-RA.1